MKKFELNGLGKGWVWEANNEKEATSMYIYEVCGSNSLKEYISYCHDVHVDPAIIWREVEIEQEAGYI